MSVQAGQLCRPRMSTKVKPGDLIMFNCYMNVQNLSVQAADSPGEGPRDGGLCAGGGGRVQQSFHCQRGGFL